MAACSVRVTYGIVNSVQNLITIVIVKSPLHPLNHLYKHWPVKFKLSPEIPQRNVLNFRGLIVLEAFRSALKDTDGS
jgi:hypothetical protein